MGRRGARLRGAARCGIPRRREARGCTLARHPSRSTRRHPHASPHTPPCSTLLDKSRQLRFITHFVGDVHQPLHAASYFSSQFPDGDMGGNAWPVAGVNYTQELHAVWDSGVGQWVDDLPRPLNATSAAALSSFASAVIAEFPASDPAIAALILETAPLTWATESNALAASVVYNAPQAPTPLTADYIAQGQVLCRRQIALGGYRLATLLEYIFTAVDEPARGWREEAEQQARAPKGLRGGERG